MSVSDMPELPATYFASSALARTAALGWSTLLRPRVTPNLDHVYPSRNRWHTLRETEDGWQIVNALPEAIKADASTMAAFHRRWNSGPDVLFVFTEPLAGSATVEMFLWDGAVWNAKPLTVYGT